MITDLDVIATIDPETVVAQMGVFVLTTSGVIVSGEPSYDEWHDTVVWAQKVAKHSPFWEADLLLYGENKFGEKYTQAIQATGKSVGTLMNETYVAKAVPLDRRREALTFAHHAEVAPLTPDEQTAWLAKAEADDLSAKELRTAIKVAKATESGKTLEYFVIVRCVDEADQQLLLNQLEMNGRTCHAQTREIG